MRDAVAADPRPHRLHDPERRHLPGADGRRERPVLRRGLRRPRRRGAVRTPSTLVDLADRADTVAGTLSGGQRRRLSLACALIHRPPVLFLDEPTVGVDPLLRVQFWGHFRALADAGTTIVVSSHVMDEADRCDELLFIRAGRSSPAARGGAPRARPAPTTSSRRSSSSRGAGTARHERAGASRALFRRVVAGDPARPPVARAAVHRPDLDHRPRHVHPPRGPDARRRRRRRQRGGRAGRRRGRGARGPALARPGVDRDRRRPTRRRARSRSRTARSTWRSCSRRTLGRSARRRSASSRTASTRRARRPSWRVASSRRSLSAAAASLGRGLPTIEHATVYGSPERRPDRRRSRRRIVGFFVYFFVYLLTGVSFLRERTGGTLERLMATPVTRGEIVAGYTLGFGLFATIQVALLMPWALGTIHVPSIGPLPAFSIGLGIPVAGSPLLAFVVVLAARRGRGQPRDLPLDVRPHRAPGHPVHPARARAAVPAVGRPVPGQHPARRSSSRSCR